VGGLRHQPASVERLRFFLNNVPQACLHRHLGRGLPWRLQPMGEILDVDLVSDRRLLDYNRDRRKTLTDLAYPVIARKSRKAGAMASLESSSGDMDRVFETARSNSLTNQQTVASARLHWQIGAPRLSP
jgi:hypothetical protein